MENLNIVIAGGAGFIGRALATYFGSSNKVFILTRNLEQSLNNARGKHSFPAETRNNIQCITWDGKNKGVWYRYIDGADIIINLSGKSVNCRYTPKNKQEIFESSTQPTAASGGGIRRERESPK